MWVRVRGERRVAEEAYTLAYTLAVEVTGSSSSSRPPTRGPCPQLYPTPRRLLPTLTWRKLQDVCSMDLWQKTTKYQHSV